MILECSFDELVENVWSEQLVYISAWKIVCEWLKDGISVCSGHLKQSSDTPPDPRLCRTHPTVHLNQCFQLARQCALDIGRVHQCRVPLALPYI